jgi:hypothetical protein
VWEGSQQYHILTRVNINEYFFDYVTDALSAAVGPETRAYIGFTAMCLVCILIAPLFKRVSPVDILKLVIL